MPKAAKNRAESSNPVVPHVRKVKSKRAVQAAPAPIDAEASRKWLEEYEALVVEMGKFEIPPFDAEDIGREREN